MRWENSLAGAHLIENFFNLFSIGISSNSKVFMANEMYQLKEKEKLKFPKVLDFQLTRKRHKDFSQNWSVFWVYCTYSTLWQCSNSHQIQETVKESEELFFSSFLGVKRWRELSDFHSFFFSSRLFTQVCGHIFITRILWLALRQSTRGWGRTTSVLTPRRTWTPGSGLWTRLLSCRHVPHWRGKSHSEALTKISK